MNARKHLVPMILTPIRCKGNAMLLGVWKQGGVAVTAMIRQTWPPTLTTTPRLFSSSYISITRSSDSCDMITKRSANQAPPRSTGGRTHRNQCSQFRGWSLPKATKWSRRNINKFVDHNAFETILSEGANKIDSAPGRQNFAAIIVYERKYLLKTKL